MRMKKKDSSTVYYDGMDCFKPFRSPGECFLSLVPTYTFINWENLLFSYKWDSDQVKKVLDINPQKAMRRVDTYLNTIELMRFRDKLRNKSSASIRFGVEKEGRGWHNGERGDFCLVGGSYSKKKKELTLFYRSLDMIGGFNWDLSIIRHLIIYSCVIEKVTIYARNARAFAKKGNSNEKFYYQLKEIYESKI